MPSSLNTAGILAQIVPHKPATAPTRNIGTTIDKLMVDYALPTALLTGGNTILSLNLQWDQGTSGSQWSTLIGE